MSDFWARRKQAVEAESEAEVREEEAARIAEDHAELEGLPEAEVLERLGLPDPDSIGPGDDVTGFMREAVPAWLRNRALRRLWVSNPVLANLDGLADYADDFTGNGLKGAAIRTTYQVGKGLAAHVEKMAEEAERAAAEQPSQVEDEDVKSSKVEDVDEKKIARSAPDVEPFDSMPSDSAFDGREGGLRPRMMFSFEEETADECADPAGSEPTGT